MSVSAPLSSRNWTASMWLPSTAWTVTVTHSTWDVCVRALVQQELNSLYVASFHRLIIVIIRSYTLVKECRIEKYKGHRFHFTPTPINLSVYSTSPHPLMIQISVIFDFFYFLFATIFARQGSLDTSASGTGRGHRWSHLFQDLHWFQWQRWSTTTTKSDYLI